MLSEALDELNEMLKVALVKGLRERKLIDYSADVSVRYEQEKILISIVPQRNATWFCPKHKKRVAEYHDRFTATDAACLQAILNFIDYSLRFGK